MPGHSRISAQPKARPCNEAEACNSDLVLVYESAYTPQGSQHLSQHVGTAKKRMTSHFRLIDDSHYLPVSACRSSSDVKVATPPFLTKLLKVKTSVAIKFMITSLLCGE